VSGPTQKDDGGGDERFGNGARAAPSEAPLQGLAELVEPRIHPDEPADDSTQQDRAENIEQVRRVDRELQAHRGYEQADASDDVLPRSLGQAIAEHHAEQTADEGRRGVEKSSGERGHEGP
jgi:hypothetical protein